MAEPTQKVINTTFQFKRGTAAALTQANITLKDGEPGFELDTGNLKIGRGNTPWNNLPYLVSDTTIANTINTSPTVQQIITQQVNNVLATKTLLTFKGEAFTIEEDLNNNITAIYDDNMQEIQGQVGDVYSYHGQEYVYDNESGHWVELSSESSKDDLVTQEEFRALKQMISNVATPPLATAQSAGLVKSSNATNQISVGNDGTMTINSMGIDKLVNVQNVELILDGGLASN